MSFSVYIVISNYMHTLSTIMKKIFVLIILMIYTFPVNGQHFLETFNEEYFDTWGNANFVDAFGDAGEEKLPSFITKGIYEDENGNTKNIFVIVIVDIKNEYLSIDILDEKYQLLDYHKLNHDVLIKDMKQNKIEKYRFSSGENTSLSAPIKNNEYRAIPVKLMLDGDGQELKFKVYELTWISYSGKGEYSFSILAWDNNLRKLYR